MDNCALAALELLVPFLWIVELDVQDVAANCEQSAFTGIIHQVRTLSHPDEGIPLLHALLPRGFHPNTSLAFMLEPLK